MRYFLLVFGLLFFWSCSKKIGYTDGYEGKSKSIIVNLVDELSINCINKSDIEKYYNKALRIDSLSTSLISQIKNGNNSLDEFHQFFEEVVPMEFDDRIQNSYNNYRKKELTDYEIISEITHISILKIQELYSQQKRSLFTFDAITPVVQKSSSNIKLGEPFRADFLVAGLGDSNSVIAVIDGDTIKSDKGIPFFEIEPQKKGNFIHNGEIIFVSVTGKTIVMPIVVTYQVH